ncbi:orotate phosphoribosyltransferase [Pedobacter glucosidilyticus]|uniref:orotate phosphoribosyltransferase n=1 Tax=Pedobacter glucosidilyticus TaxID=1122941 RepID=UPI000408C286|nr:orotate phosphoribosyltransferase [Pedobacter glucosidilyticus]
MTIFESKTTLSKSVAEVYQFLEDLNNHQLLMPENIYNWSSTRDEARFTIQNMAKLALKVEERIVNERITITPAEEAPIVLNLVWSLSEIDHQTQATLTISAELNMMMKMLASGPLQKLADFQTQALQNKLG